MLKPRSLVLAALALLLVGVAGYAYLNPAFAATCKSAYSTGASWVQRQAAAAETAFKSSKANDSYQAGLRKSAEWRQKLNQKAADPSPKKSPPASVAAVPAASRQQAQAQAPPAPRQAQAASLSAGQRIANGHAFGKHAGEFGFSSKSQLADHINRVISRAGGSNVRSLKGGRKAYWDEGSGTVVIVDPNTADGGTSFKPGRGRKYFEGLK